MEITSSKNGVSVRIYKGDAMSLIAFDVTEKLSENLAGFTIQYSYKKANVLESFYAFNRLGFPDSFFVKNANIAPRDRNSTLYSPIQKFNWVHVPNTNINTGEPIFGKYTYKITPRYVVGSVLLPIDSKLSVSVKIDVSPYNLKNTELGFTRGFVSSVAYAKRFNVENNRVRPPKAQDSLLFDVKQVADVAKRWNETTRKVEDVPYTFEEQHEWLGWQARARCIAFLDEALADKSLTVKAFCYDLNEPEACKRLLELAKQNRLSMILDNSGSHGDADSMETAFENAFKAATNPEAMYRGKFKALAHSKVFVHLKNGKAVKVLTGSTNFSTNGLYVNSNHVLVFKNAKIAQLYADVFDASFGKENMDNFKNSAFASTDFAFNEADSPTMTITFAPHQLIDAQRIFDRVSNRIKQEGNTDVLFAIMSDTSESSILDAVKTQVKKDDVYTYGITDTIGKKDEDYSVFLYKPQSINGIRIAAKGISNVLPEPFGKVAKVDGYAIHHKFVVVNFKGSDPVVYCGSSNLAFGPEQRNGDNLLEIHDKDIVTAFAIEALRLVDHFQWRNKELNANEPLHLDDLSTPNKAWYKAWFDPKDLKNRQRLLYIRP
jgi:phosphatidylserine/phosphatidylglycerophosphate/cardiolipin synthase-like enzyme